MFGIGWPEFLLILGVAIVIIGPNDIPRAVYSVGKFIKKIKAMSGEVTSSLESVMLEGELQEIAREANKAGVDNIEAELAKQTEAELDVEIEKEAISG